MRNIVIVSQSTVSMASVLALDHVWYADFDRGKFKTVNDNNHWLQIDKEVMHFLLIN